MSEYERRLSTFCTAESQRQWRFAQWRSQIFAPLARFLNRRFALHPNFFTILGAAFLIPYAIFFAREPKLAACFLFPYVFFDGFDGAYARICGKESRGGALLDLISDHLGMIVSVALVIVNKLADAGLAAYYGMIYLGMITLVIYQNLLGIPPRWLLRSKYLLFCAIMLWVFFKINFIELLFLIFAPIMTINCTISSYKLYKYLNLIRKI